LKNGRSIPDKNPRGPVFLNIPGSRLGRGFWTHENHAVELNTNSMIETRLNYIHENPVRAGLVAEAEDYLYSNARNYAEMESLIEIDFI